MKFKVPFKLVESCPPIILSPMYTKDEKAILEYQVIQDDLNLVFEAVCEMLQIPEWLPLDLKVACIYKVREISFGGNLQLRYICEKCGRLTESQIILENLLEFMDVPKEIQDLELKESQLQEILDFKIASAYLHFKDVSKPQSIREASKYAIALKSKIPAIKRTLDSKCFFCHNIKKINIINKKFLIDSLSEQTLLTMFKMYNALATNGFGKLDVDSMLPFEREMHGMLFKERTSEILEASKIKGQ